jgi:hypothetical protein
MDDTAAGRRQGVKAVAREPVDRDVVPEDAGRCDHGQQATDDVAEVPLRSGNVLTTVHERCQLCVVRSASTGAVVVAGTAGGDSWRDPATT